MVKSGLMDTAEMTMTMTQMDGVTLHLPPGPLGLLVPSVAYNHALSGKEEGGENSW